MLSSLFRIALFGMIVLLPSLGWAQDSWWGAFNRAVNSPAAQKTIQDLTAPQSPASSAALSATDISAGLREALSMSSDHVVKKLGVEGGFNLDPKIHIPLPGGLKSVDQALSRVGLGKLTNDLELRLNQAAETATPKAKQLFLDAIKNMTLKDAKAILNGPQDAATQYLRRSMGTDLQKDMAPIVTEALTHAGAIKSYDAVMGEYDQLPFMPDVKANLTQYVTGKATDGIFYYIAQEEALIRQNPTKRTTALLKKVFGSK